MNYRLMDYEMPVMNGPTAAKEIRDLGSDVFIVGVTGNMLNEDVEFFMANGANVVLQPVFWEYPAALAYNSSRSLVPTSEEAP